ncbi:Organic anion transporter 1 [Intoshia linei]|uniref:Organic anion transporter 1 n=1 Tax=Intoshia linei TaxID=1819745 RepID=A0A177ATT0_9BILA|nr:Organic anion transporter 1 [Intoshia linei]
MNSQEPVSVALHQLTSTRRYQVFIFLVISIFDSIPSIIHMNAFTFLGYTPKHRCAMGLNDTEYSHYQNVNYTNSIGKNFKCYLPNNKSCDKGWVFDKSFIQSSTTSEWNLVCENNILPEMSQAMFNVGVMIGALIFGHLSDRFGRKKIFISCLVLQSLFGTIAAFVTHFTLFVVIRMIVGCLEQGINIVGFIMAIELFLPKDRTVFAVSHEYFWALGGCILPFIAYFVREWRILQIIISAPWVIAIVLLWLLPESIVWLISKNKFNKVNKILSTGNKFYRNKTIKENIFNDNISLSTSKKIPKDSFNAHLTYETKPDYPNIPKSPKSLNVTYLFRTKKLRTITSSLSVLWLLNTAAYYGWSYNTPNLNGNLYFNFFLAHIIEIPSCFLTVVLISKFGRIKPLIIFHLMGGIVCIISVFIPNDVNGYSIRWLQTVFALIGKFAFNSSYTIIYIYGPEIYPTTLRTTGFYFF